MKSARSALQNTSIHDKTIILEHISGEKMVADMLTKAAEANIVNRCVKSMGLLYL